MKQYDNIFKEQLQAGIIEEVTEEGEVVQTHYLPQRPVLRNDKATTKLRVVFDASAASKGPSLNSCLYKEPQLTPLLFDILIRFRSKNVALVGDIEKGFLQIAISENDCNYLKFLWFDNVFKEFPSIVKYRFARVVFGVTSSPFLLNGTIEKLKIQYKNYNYDPELVTTVLRSFFVDDFTGGSNNTQNTCELFMKLKIRFFEGKFNFTKWRTNDILSQLISDCESTELLSVEGKILGVGWNDQSDKFLFDIKEDCRHIRRSMCHQAQRFEKIGSLLRSTRTEIIAITKSYVEVRYQTDGLPNARKRSKLLF